MVGLSSTRCGCRCECVTTTTNVVRNRNNDDAPDAVLEGLAMAGLVAILRQLGDLAELAAEVFDDMQDQVTAASARGRRLAVRAKRLLEADLDLLPPPTSTHHSSSSAATERTERRRALNVNDDCGGAGRLVGGGGGGGGEGGGGVGGDTPPMPRLVVQRIRRCRGPPRLSLLDRFDAAGEGACLKRYTDPSFFFRAHSHSATASASGSGRLQVEQGTLRVRANRGPYHQKSMSMETRRPKFQTALLNSGPPESAHTDSISETETETDASEAPSPGFLSMLRQLKQHRQAAGANAGVSTSTNTSISHQPANRVRSSPQLNMEKGGSTAQPSPSPSPSELERTSSFEAWLSPDAHRFTAAAATTPHHKHNENITHEPPDDAAATTTCGGSVVVTTSNADADADVDAALTTLSSSSTMLKASKVKGAGAGNKSRSSRMRYRGSLALEMKMIASRVSSLPRKLFINIRHHKDCSRSDDRGTSLRISQTTGIGDCRPQLEAIPTPRPRPRAREAAFLPILLHSNPAVYSSINDRDLLPGNDNEEHSYLEHQHQHHGSILPSAERHHQQEEDQCSDSNSSTPPDNNKNPVLPAGSLVLKRAAGALPLPPENSSSEDAEVDTAPPPLPPIPPMQWLSEKVHAGPRAASPKHRALWGKSLIMEVDRASLDRSSNALRSVSTQVAETIQATSHSTSPVDTEETLVVSDENTSRDEMKCCGSEETRHPQPSRVREDAVQASSELHGIVLKAGEFPVPALLSDEAWTSEGTQEQADSCSQQQGRLQFGTRASEAHSDEKRSQEHEASDDSSNLQKNESVFFSAIQELAKMSPPPPSVPRPKYSLLDAGSHARITLRNGPSLIHPSRNILDSRNVLIQQIKDIATAGNPSFKLKPVSGASSPVTGSPSPTNSKVATILRRADDIRQANANSHDVDSDESWSDDTE